jgi:hypothetical protein
MIALNYIQGDVGTAGALSMQPVGFLAALRSGALASVYAIDLIGSAAHQGAAVGQQPVRYCRTIRPVQRPPAGWRRSPTSSLRLYQKLGFSVMVRMPHLHV